MFHLVVHTLPGTLLFRTNEEARALWDQFVARVRFRSLSLMPTHVHLDPPDDGQIESLRAAKVGYALWRNRHRGESGPVWQEGISRREVDGEQHVDRTRRYIHLNPCRHRLVTDPLAWAFSTHRDACGLALPPACRRAANPADFHAYVSADRWVHPEGTRLPEPRPGSQDRGASVGEVLAAVSALTRTPAAMLRRRGPARDLFTRAARTLTKASSTAIAAFAAVDASTVRHARPLVGPSLLLIESVLGDPRFALLHDGDLRREPAWRKYRHLR